MYLPEVTRSMLFSNSARCASFALFHLMLNEVQPVFVLLYCINGIYEGGLLFTQYHL